MKRAGVSGAVAAAQQATFWLVAFAAAAAFGALVLSEGASAQEVGKGAASPPKAASGVAPAASAAGGGFAERLVPKAKKGPAGAKAPYMPIRPPQDEGQVPEVEMFVGESRVFPAPGVARIAVGNGSILNAAALDDKEVILFANGAGTSSLFIWNEDGRYQRVKINIVPGDTSRVAREIAAFLSSVPNARASVIGDKVVVEGDKLSDNDLLKISKLAERYPQILNFTDTVGWERMVQLDVKVVEFPTSVLREIGLKWNPTGGAALGAVWAPVRRGDDGPYVLDIRTGTDNAPPVKPLDGSGPVRLPSGLNLLGGLNMGLNAQLNLLAQEGKAAVLAEPQLSARNGASASFLAGGEIPYSVSNANGTTISFKPYGIKLDIEPRVDRNGVIRAKIEAEVSAVDSSVVGTGGGPALTTRRTKTEFNLHAGETFVLSGLLQRGTSTDIEKIPFLGDIPVLGALFRSKRFQNKETELVVFVTPTVVDAKSPAIADRVEKVHERLHQEFGERPTLSDPAQVARDTASPAAPSAEAQAQAQRLIAGAGGSTLQVVRDGVVLRALPDAGSTALLQLGVGSLVQLGRADIRHRGALAWRNVVVGDLNGWVQADDLVAAGFDRPVPPESALARQDQAGRVVPLQAPAGAQDTMPAYRVMLPELAMRVTPDINAPVVQRLSKGDLVRRLPEPARGYWIPVEAHGRKGWVAGQWLDPLVAVEPGALR
jgi:pilus assembly protein CpaC